MLTTRSNLVGRIRSGPTLLLLALNLFAFARQATAATQQPSQSDVEAVYLFDFGKFIRWPAGAEQGPMAICVAGSSSFAVELQKTVSNETINGRSLDVRQVMHSADVSGCAILFIEAALGSRAAEILDATAGKPTLTVSDMPDFLSRGGMIQFQLVEKRVRFSVNLDAVTRSRLTMSSELLKVALSVKGKIPEGGAQ